MEIEVGEYVRTVNGTIEKVINPNFYIEIYIECENDIITRNHIVKHSKNIIDLIEVGDYVNGYRVYHVAGHYVSVESFEKYDLCFEEQDIKTIVTHEQFESIKYKVEKGAEE